VVCLMCVIVMPRKMRRPRPPRGCRAIEKKRNYICSLNFINIPVVICETKISDVNANSFPYFPFKYSHTFRLSTSHTFRLSTSHTFRLNTSHTFRLSTSHTFRLNTSHIFRLSTSHTFRLSTSHTFRLNTSHTFRLSTSHPFRLSTSHTFRLSTSHKEHIMSDTNSISIISIYAFEKSVPRAQVHNNLFVTRTTNNFISRSLVNQGPVTTLSFIYSCYRHPCSSS
jgi:hypothetical protein